MPSQSLSTFYYNLVDVKRLVESHGKLHAGNPGKKGLGHITRSGVVMLCAAWELYVEVLLQEAANILCTAHGQVTALPLDVQKQLSFAVKADKNELGPLRLAGDGWKIVYAEIVKGRTEGLNTPKSAKLIPLFSQLLGVADISLAWSSGVAALDEFVSNRGDIAHRGRHAKYVPIATLSANIDSVLLYAKETDNYVNDYLRTVIPSGKKPWKNAA